MAYTGLWLKGARGKYAGGVLQNSPGGTILRENVKPSNPQTRAQVETRTGFKLMSQVAQSLSPVIAMRRDGARSPRNVFVKQNWPLVVLNGDEAQITYENLQLTKSNVAFPDFTAERSTGGDLFVQFSYAMPNVSRIVCVVFSKNSERKLQLLGSKIVSYESIEDDLNIDYPYILEDHQNEDIIVFCYGIIDANANATVNYGNMQANSGVDIVKLISEGKLSSAQFTFTETRGATIFAGETESTAIDTTKARVYVTASGPGTVSGGGQYAPGSTVTLRATPTGSADFSGWYSNGGSTLVSQANPYTFTVQSTQTIDLVALFEELTPQTP